MSSLLQRPAEEGKAKDMVVTATGRAGVSLHLDGPHHHRHGITLSSQSHMAVASWGPLLCVCCMCFEGETITAGGQVAMVRSSSWRRQLGLLCSR